MAGQVSIRHELFQQGNFAKQIVGFLSPRSSDSVRAVLHGFFITCAQSLHGDFTGRLPLAWPGDFWLLSKRLAGSGIGETCQKRLTIGQVAQ
jgi:hypothetical protein